MARANVRLDGLVIFALLAALLNVGCSADETSSASAASTPSALSSGGDAEAVVVSPEANKQARALAQTLYTIQALDRLRKGGVRRSMELTDEQWSLVLELGGEADELGKECQASPPEQAEEFAARYKELVERVERELRGSLSQDQYAAQRLAVVQGQIGATVFLMPGVAKTIELTETQLAHICNDIYAHNDELQPRNFTLWNLRKLIALGRSLRAKAEARLDESQQERWGAVLAGTHAIVD